MRKSFVLLVMLCPLAPSAAAQVKSAFLGTSNDFLKSSFCKQYKCFPAGTLKLSNDNVEEYYMVSGFKNPANGLDKYLVFFTKCKNFEPCNNLWIRAGLRYPPVQDMAEDGAFAIDFFSFVSGVPLHAYPAEKLFNACINAVRGKDEYFFLEAGNVIASGNAAEETIIMNRASAFGASWFEKESPTTRVATSSMCKR